MFWWILAGFLLICIIGVFYEENIKPTLGYAEPRQDPYVIGKRFEDTALRIFPEDGFSIVHKTVGAADLNGRATEDCIYPDYKFRDLTTGRVFWVECKYRSSRYNLSWTDEEHRSRYLRIEAETGITVYVLLGVGGTPERPDTLHFFALDRMPYTTLYDSTLDACRITDRSYESLGDIVMTAGEPYATGPSRRDRESKRRSRGGQQSPVGVFFISCGGR
ncbi:MAG: hypothetical protein Q4Q58_03275 [Thermoplasmata archaeon]|nr:hypothetical protein [Thermoplasmata archaeon]